MASPLEAARLLAAQAVSLLLTRAELATVELAQARAQLLRWTALSLFGALLCLLAFGCLSALLVLLLWERFAALTLLVLTLIYGALGIVLFRRLQRQIANAEPPLSATVAELQKDQAALTGNDHGVTGGKS